MKPIQLLNLPVELLCHVLECLDVHDLLSCTMLNKRIRKVTLDSSRLQYTMELAMHCMVSVLPATAAPSFAKRLELLRKRESAWRSLAWGGRYELELPPTGSTYEFIGGFYGNGREDEGRATASISFFELPSAKNASGNGSNLRMWTHLMGDAVVIDFTMDPSQDLLVLVAATPSDSTFVYELHLRTLSTNEPHPKAPLPILPCFPKSTENNPHPTEVGGAVRVQVAGDLVALLIKEVLDGVGAHLEIWDWENSPQFSCTMSRMAGIDDFCFLSHDAFLVVHPSGILEVCTFQTPFTASTMPISRVSYALPQLSRGYTYWYISMSSNPTPGYVPRENSGPAPRVPDPGSNGSCCEDSKDWGRAKQVYYPSPDERIHACCVYIFSTHDNHIHSFVFFMNINIFLKPNAWFSPPPFTTPIVRTISMSSTSSSSSMDSSSSEPSSLASSSSLSTADSSVNIPISTVPATAGLPLSSSYQHQTVPSSYPLVPSFSSPTPSRSPSPSIPHSHPLYTHPSPSSSPSTPFYSTTSSACASPINSTTMSSIRWDLWGPQNTRWFEECFSTDWQHGTYGLKTADSVPAPVDDAVLGVPAQEDTRQSGEGTGTSDGPGVGGEWNVGGQGMGSGSDSQDGNGNGNETDDGEDQENEPVKKQCLRIRDFNPYFIRHGLDFDGSNGKDRAAEYWKGKNAIGWKTRRIVTGPSTTPVHGVFTRDIVSSLPYAEAVSEEAFDVSDVMVDDSRVLLLKRSRQGHLKGINVLTI